MEELPAAFADEPDALFYIGEAVENARADLDELGLGGLLGGALLRTSAGFSGTN